jgi:ribonuclease P protein component
MASARFRRCQRIRGDIQFERIRKQGAAAGDGVLFVRALANGRGTVRLGLAVGRAAGGAVVRSRLRRMIRETFRACSSELPAGLDLLVATRSGAAGAALAQVRRSLVALAGRVAAELEKRRPPEDNRGPGRSGASRD